MDPLGPQAECEVLANRRHPHKQFPAVKDVFGASNSRGMAESSLRPNSINFLLVHRAHVACRSEIYMSIVNKREPAV